MGGDKRLIHGRHTNLRAFLQVTVLIARCAGEGDVERLNFLTWYRWEGGSV